jgi:NAD(P)-dependent dehydrogenase (short-subunit alcohol dehydrogenase family)
VPDPVAIVTGASRGIGRRLSIDLAEAGYDVACAARSTGTGRGGLPGTVEETAAEVEKRGRRAMAVALDVRDEPAVASLVERVYAEWGRCDLVVNNAAVAPPGRALDDSVKRWRLAVDVNLNGPFYLCYHAGRRMREAGEGRIVNVSSGAAVMPSFGRPSYTATKRALEALTEALAHELRGIVAVNCIRLDVPVWTEGFDATLPDDFDTSGFEDPVIVSDAVRWLARRPLAETGRVMGIGELRSLGAVRPTSRPAGRDAGSGAGPEGSSRIG